MASRTDAMQSNTTPSAAQGTKAAAPANGNVIKRYNQALKHPNQSNEQQLTPFPLQPAIRTHDPDDLPHPGHLRLPDRRPNKMERNPVRPRRHSLRQPGLQTHPRLPRQLPLRAARGPVQNAHLPPQRRHERAHLPGHPQARRAREGGRVERGVEHGECVVEYSEFAGGAE